MDPKQKAVIEKVCKILALAEGAGTEAEAANALSHARKIMRTYGLTFHDVESITVSDLIENDSDKVTDSKGKFPAHVKYLASVALYFDCGVYLHSRYNADTQKPEGVLRFYGRPEDVEASRYSFAFLLRELTRLTKTFRKSRTEQGMGTKKSTIRHYQKGCALGILEMMRKLKEEDPEEQTKDCMALVLVKHQAVDEYSREKLTHLSKGHPTKRPKGSEAYYRGKIDGRNVKYHQGVEGPSAKGELE